MSMMKKLLLILIAAATVSPLYAQVGNAGRAVTSVVEGSARGTELAAGVSRKVAAQTVTPAAALRLAQITNLPGKPLVQVRLNTDETSPLEEILPVRILPSIQIYKSVSPLGSRQLYVPSAFTETKNVLYRGMRFTKLSDVENLLLRGLEIRLSAYSEIYFAYLFSMAMGYTLPRIPDEEVKGDFPIVVKVPVIPQLPVSQTGVTAQAYQDLPAEFISDVMVFLEINGRADWYKAIVENNKLVLVSVPTTYTPGWLPRWLEP